MTRLNVKDARCVALFASELQRSDTPAPGELPEVLSRTVRRFGTAGCASRMAQEFGDHPQAAVSRMRWIRQLISEPPAPAAPRTGAALRTPADWPPVPGLSPRNPRAAAVGAHRAA
jgi:hypothetical protein